MEKPSVMWYNMNNSNMSVADHGVNSNIGQNTMKRG